ncbi:MAG: hypothetical protein M1840_009000 [Geoglossum simile]|nr:MAG: hypothetical protein M1840_009000 [Geoglossum simile]
MLFRIPLLALAGAVLGQDTTTVTTNITESGKAVTVTVNVTEAVDAFNEGLKLSGESLDGDVSTAATRLVLYSGCNRNQRSLIYAGWQDSWKLMKATAKDINYNEGAAIDFLGAPGLNTPVQGRLSGKPPVFYQDLLKLPCSPNSALFANAATIRPGGFPDWFDWRIHVRCDDPTQQCSCAGPDSPEEGAYTINADENSGLAMINFCPLYFRLHSLSGIIELGRGATNPDIKWDIRHYERNRGRNAHLSNAIGAFAKESTGRVWFHELMHIDWVAQAGEYGPNQRVLDTYIVMSQGSGQVRTRAYGALLAKALARYPHDTGSWVIQNADSLALFALSKYVQKKLGAYPHYPIVANPPLAVPPQNPFEVDSDGKLTVNETNPLAAEFAGLDTTCNNIEDDENPPVILNLDSWAPDSAYPADYLAEQRMWAANYSGGATSSPPPTQAPPGAFHIIGLKSTEPTRVDHQGYVENSIKVVPATGYSCSNTVINSAQYAALAVDSTGNNFLAPESLITQTAFSLTQGLVNNEAGENLCGVAGATITLTAAANNSGFTFDDGKGTTGSCQASTSSSTCEDGSGKSYTATEYITCQTPDHPHYCGN